MIFGLLSESCLFSLSTFFKPMPDDVVLFFSSLSVAFCYLFANRNGIYRPGDFWWIVGPVIVMIVFPLFYSSYVQMKDKEVDFYS